MSAVTGSVKNAYVQGFQNGPYEMPFTQYIDGYLRQVVSDDAWTQEGDSPEMEAHLYSDLAARRTLKLRFKDVILAFPAKIELTFIIHVETTESPMSMFRYADGSEMITSVHPHPKGPIQATIVRNPDVSLTLHTAPALPKQTKVEE